LILSFDRSVRKGLCGEYKGSTAIVVENTLHFKAVCASKLRNQPPCVHCSVTEIFGLKRQSMSLLRHLRKAKIYPSMDIPDIGLKPNNQYGVPQTVTRIGSLNRILIN